MSAVTTRLVVAGALSLLIAACTAPTNPTRLPPIVPPSQTSTPPPVPALVVFNEPATGFSTSDLYDAHDRIVQLTTTGDLVWTPDGTRLPGHGVASWSHYYGPPPIYFISGPRICADIPCDFSVRFGASSGKRRAYLTVDYGHDNPGTLVDVDVVSGSLVVTQTSSYAPGTPTLSGLVTESTPAGQVPVAGAWVYRGVPAGWQGGTTDQNGFYELRGLIDGTDKVLLSKPGYQAESRGIALYGDVRLDVELVRQ